MRDTAKYALDAMMKAGADKASCVATKGRKDEFNVEANKFTLLRTLFSDQLSLKVIIGGKKGTASVNKLDRDSVDRAVAECVALTASASPDEAEDVAPLLQNKNFDRRIGGADMDALFKRSKEFMEQVKDEFPKIELAGMTSEFNSGNATYVNSNGVEFNSQTEYYNAGSFFVAKDGAKASSFNGWDSTVTSLDAPFMDLGMQRALLEESVRSIDTRMTEGKFVGKVIVTPACADMVWGTLIGCFLSDVSMIQGTSRWKDSLGQRVTDVKLTLRAAPLHPMMPVGERFTGDGFESKDFCFIENGILKSFALSLYGANKTGKPRALNTGYYNLEIPEGDTPLSEMIKSVGKGILLNRFSGGSPGPNGDVSGVAKNSFMIENGEITDAISETMVSFNLVEILQSIPAISKERISDGSSLLPWCCFDGITISGK